MSGGGGGGGAKGTKGAMLVFDFDGVLMDSKREVVVTAYNAVGRGGAAGGLDYKGCLEEPAVIWLGEIPSEVKASFLSSYHLARGAADLYALMAWSRVDGSRTEGRRVDGALSEKDFDRFKREMGVPDGERSRRFFAERRRVFGADTDRWRALNRPFQPLWDALRERGGERVVIVTNKNREAVWDLCRHFAMPVPEANILGSDEGAGKTENLRKIHERFGLPRYGVVEDAVSNLRGLAADFAEGEPAVWPIFAVWGYQGPEDLATARAAGFDTRDMDELINMLDVYLPEIAGS